MARIIGKGYSFDDLLKDGKTVWDGVRNYQARNNLQAMRVGDQVLFYHSVSEKSVVGVAEVSRESFPDPNDEKWMAVEIVPIEKFEKSVTLNEIKAAKSLENIALIKQSRLSVMPLTKIEFGTIIKLKKELYEIIAKHSNQTFDKVWADSYRDYWMTAEEAKAYSQSSIWRLRRKSWNAIFWRTSWPPSPHRGRPTAIPRSMMY